MRPFYVDGERPNEANGKVPLAFGLSNIFYIVALFASGMAAIGGWGFIAACYVLGFWLWKIYAPKRDFTFANLVFVFAIVALLIALLLPAVAAARTAARWNHCANNLALLSRVLVQYEASHGSLPPAYISDKNGKPMHSWRVLLLPYLEQNSLYELYDFSEPWDGPNNRKLAAYIPDVFRCPGHGEKIDNKQVFCSYFVAVGPGTAFPGAAKGKMSTAPDGPSQTIMLIEAHELGIQWMEPRDVTIDQAIQFMTKAGSGHLIMHVTFFQTTYSHSSMRSAAFGDGHIEYLGQLRDPNVAKGLFTIGGGETLPKEHYESFENVELPIKTVVKWDKIYALSLFALLAFLPTLRAFRQPRTNASLPA